MKHLFLKIIITSLTFYTGIFIAQMYPNNKPEWRTLLLFENRDLSVLEKEKYPLLEAIKVLTKKKFRNPKLFAKISNSQGQSRYILVDVINPAATSFPGKLSVWIFDTNGIVLNSSTFPTGCWTFVKKINVVYKSELGREVIEVETDPESIKQYYALIDDEIVLVRIEDSKGNLVVSDYTQPIGPPLKSVKMSN